MPDRGEEPRDPRHADGNVQLVAHVDAGYITLAQTARYLAVSTRTIRRWVTSRGLPHYYIGGAERGKFLFRKGELDRWVRRFKNGFAARNSGKALDGMGPEAL